MDVEGVGVLCSVGGLDDKTGEREEGFNKVYEEMVLMRWRPWRIAWNIYTGSNV